MPVTAWQVEHAGEVWGADGATITPAALVDAVQAHEGEQRFTYFGKPYVLRAADAASVYDYFDTEVDPGSDRTIQRWEYAPDENAGTVY
jgi:hypothetical protein